MLKKILNFFVRTAPKVTVDHVVADLQYLAEVLAEVEAEHAGDISLFDEQIAVLEDARTLAVAESERAARVAEKIKGLLA